MKPKLEAKHSLLSVRRLITRWSVTWQIPSFASFVTFEWSSRLTRSLGRAYPARMLVRLSMLLQQQPYAQLFHEVLCHEVAHLAVYRIYGSTASFHGTEWKQLLAKAGYQPRRGLYIDPPENRKMSTLTYVHSCAVCQTRRIAKRPQASWRCMVCRNDGLEGNLIIHSLPSKKGGRNA